MSGIWSSRSDETGCRFVRAAAQLGSVLLFAVLPVVIVPLLLHAAGSDYLWDFRKEFLPAGRAILDGHSPYPHSLGKLASHANYVYPPLAALLLAPFTWLPPALADGLFVALSLAAPALALWLLRRARLALLRARVPVAAAARRRLARHALAAPGARGRSRLALAQLVGRARRLDRRRGRREALPVADARALRGGWPLARRGRVVVVACLAVLASWAVIGFAGLTGYPRLLQELSRIEAPRGYSPTAFALSLGLPRGLSLAVAVAVGLPLLFAAARLIRRPGGELGALACAVAASLALSPVVWLHYLILLVVPIAVARDRLGLVWFVPLLFWITPGTASNGSAWRIAFVMGVSALTLWLAGAPGRVPRTAR